LKKEAGIFRKLNGTLQQFLKQFDRFSENFEKKHDDNLKKYFF